MEIKRLVEGKKEKYFNVLKQSVLYDLKAAGCDYNDEDLKKGLVYHKTLRNSFGKEGNVKVEITAYQPSCCYAATFTSAQGINTLSYELNEKSDDMFEVIYTESFCSDKKSKNLNYALMSRLYKKSARKKADLLLDAIERMMNEKA